MSSTGKLKFTSSKNIERWAFKSFQSSKAFLEMVLVQSHSLKICFQILTFPRPSETSFDTISGFQSPYNSLESAVVINVTNFDINEEKVGVEFDFYLQHKRDHCSDICFLIQRKKSNSAFSRRLSALRPFSNIKISLGNCQIDFDISILDRIHASIDACQSQVMSFSFDLFLLNLNRTLYFSRHPRHLQRRVNL